MAHGPQSATHTRSIAHQFGLSVKVQPVRNACNQLLACPSPNLVWPADRAWFLASEIDFDSTLVGGSSELIETILGDSKLDAWLVGPG